MLQKFQPFLKIIVLVTVIAFTVSSCEKDIIDKQVEQKMTSFKVNTIKMTDIPNVTNHINRNLQRHINSRTSNTNAAIFDVDNVMEVIDSLQNTNYSIGFTFPETPTGTFYNLVVGKDTLDVLSTPFVLRYVSHADTYDAFVDSGYDMDYFNGTIHLHKYTDFFALGAFNRADTYCPPEYDENGDPISCEDTSFDGVDTGAGNSGTDYGDGDSGDSGSGSGSGTGGSNLSITYEDCRCHNTHATGGCAHPIIVINIDRGGQQRTASNTEDCPDCDVNTNGGVGVNVPRLVSLLISELNITDQNMIDWMEDPSNFDEVVLVNQWLRDNGNTTENIVFVNLALEALEDGDDIIDWGLKMVIEINETLEFQNHTCLKQIKDDVVSTEQMSKIIKKFEPTYPVLHLEWGMFTNSQWGNTGQTSLNEPEQDTAFINLNIESLSHVNNIVMVKTIAHELIHAELYRKLKELVDDYNIISLSEYNALQDNFMGIAYYINAYGDLTTETNSFGQVILWGLDPDYSLSHHNQMAAFYRQTLIDVMEAYDLSKGITRPNAEEFYEALSWAGLHQTSDENGENSQYTDAWKNFKDSIDISEANIPESERTYNRYISIINQEYNGTGINCD